MTPAVYVLAAKQITTALAAEAQTAIESLAGASAVTIEAQLQYGSGGTTAIAVVQTRMGAETLWRDVARLDFATSSAIKHCNLNGHLSKAVTAYAVLGAEGVYDGVLGDQLRSVLTTTGTYAGDTVLTVRASVR